MDTFFRVHSLLLILNSLILDLTDSLYFTLFLMDIIKCTPGNVWQSIFWRDNDFWIAATRGIVESRVVTPYGHVVFAVTPGDKSKFSQLNVSLTNKISFR